MFLHLTVFVCAHLSSRVCARLKVFASACTETVFSLRFLPPHLHEGDVVEKRADSGGFKPHLLVNDTIDGAKEGAERQK